MKKLFLIPLLFILLIPATVWMVAQWYPQAHLHHTAWLNAWLLISLGIALILVEIFALPGFNVLGIVGFLIALFGVGLCFEQFGTVWGLISAFGTVAFTAGTLWFAWKAGIWHQFINHASLPSLTERSLELNARRTIHLGKIGVAVTPLRPQGVIEINGERIEARTEGEFIAVGSEIKVVAMDTQKFIVKLN